MQVIPGRNEIARMRLQIDAVDANRRLFASSSGGGAARHVSHASRRRSLSDPRLNF